MSIHIPPLPSPILSTDTTSLNVFKQDGSQQYYSRWSAEEDRQLAKAVAELGPHKWSQVSKLIPGRTAAQCSTRWFGTLNTNIHKGRWSKTEDKALKDAVKYFQSIIPKDGNLPWNRIAEQIPHRTGIQCQARWTEALDPAVRKGRWDPEEDSQLKAAFEKFGCCWIRVASMIPTRTQRQCRTRWNQISFQKLKSKESSEKKIHKIENTTILKYNRINFMPLLFPNETAITIKQEEDNSVYPTNNNNNNNNHYMNEDACIIISSSPIGNSYQYNSHPSSPSSSRSSSFSINTSPILPALSLQTPLNDEPLTSQNILFHENSIHNDESSDLFPSITIKADDESETEFQDSLLLGDHNDMTMSSFLNNPDVDLLLNYLDDTQ